MDPRNRDIRDTSNYGGGDSSAMGGSMLNILCGIWLLIAPFVLNFSAFPAALWNSIVVGVVVLICAAIRAGNPGRYIGLSWLNVILGLWLIVSSFFLYQTVPTPFWNSIITGILVGLFGLWSAISSSQFATPDGGGSSRLMR